MKNKTLYVALVKAMKSDDLMYSYYEEMLENSQKYTRALMTHGDMVIEGCSDELCDEIFNIIVKFQKQSNDNEKKFLKKLNTKIDLTKIKNINGYTEFDFVKWDFKSKPWNYLIAFKPKNVSVSFWHADPKHINYEST